MQRVLIFRNHVLPSTQTFIAAQARALRQFTPYLVGLGPAAEQLPIEFGVKLLTTDNSARSRAIRNIYKYVGVAPRFHDQIRELGATLIHAHFAEDGVMAMHLAKRLQLPLVVTLHGGFETFNDAAHRKTANGLLYLSRRAEMWKLASVFLCVSEFIRETALRKGYPPEKLRLHHIGIDTSLFTPRDEATDKNLILFVGRLVEKKGCSILLKAMSLVQAAEPSAHLVIIGNGPLRNVLEEQAASSGISYTFLGSQSSEVIRSWLARARVFCAPSIIAKDGDSEGLGMVLAEAQAMKVPVVSSFHGGIPDIVLDGQTGLLAPEGDHVKLAEFLVKFLHDDKLWNRTRESAYRWINESFDLARQTMELEVIYSQVISSGICCRKRR